LIDSPSSKSFLETTLASSNSLNLSSVISIFLPVGLINQFTGSLSLTIVGTNNAPP
jgi:hypothetical protein